MRCALAFVTSAVISVALAGGAAAEPFQRYGVGTSLVGLDAEFSEQTRRPGPAVLVDLMGMPWDAPVAIGAHLGVAMGFNHHRYDRSFPMNSDTRETMVQLGALLEWHVGPVALGLGLNLDNHFRTVTARDDGNPAGTTDTKRALGTMLQVALDVGTIDRGTFVVVGNVERFGAPDLVMVLSGGEDDWREGTTFMLGLAFRPGR